MGVVTKSDDGGPSAADYGYIPSKHILPHDTQETEEAEPLLYKFPDNDGRPHMTQPKSKIYLEDPSNIKSEVEYDPKTGNYNVKQKVGDRDYRPETYMN